MIKTIMTKVFILSCFDQAFKILMNNIIIVNTQHMTHKRYLIIDQQIARHCVHCS